MTLGFSIIVPTLNRKEMLRDALASIRAQKWQNTEIIVVDGGSRDGTIEEITKHPEIHLLRGPDRGVYDAYNKGIAQATRDVIGLLNSDDVYESGAFASAASALSENPEAQAVCGGAALTAQKVIIATYNEKIDMRLSSPRTSMIGSCVINARFFRRQAMAKIGQFNLDYPNVSDRDWLTRWYEAGMKTIAIPERVYLYGQHSGSMTFDATRKHELVIRAELITLSRRWRCDRTTKNETRRIAFLLEGRCRAVLGLHAFRIGHIAEATQWIFCEEHHLSMSPLIALFLGGLDWLMIRFHWLRPETR